MTDVEAIKSRLNIVEIVSEKVRLKKAGVNYFGLCPFHSESTPSFSVNENLQLFKCFGCGEHGDAISFVMKTENYQFPEALESLAEKIGYKLQERGKGKDQKVIEEEDKLFKINAYVSRWFQKQLFESDNPGKEYAKKRGLTKELVKKFGIGFAPKEKTALTQDLLTKGGNEKDLEKFGLSVRKEQGLIDKFRSRLIFTIYNERGKVVGFSGRNIIPDDPNSGFKIPKYLNSPETPVFKKSSLLFGLYQAKDTIRQRNFVIVSEGQMNIISSHKAGVENIVASLGTSFTEFHAKILSRYTTNVYIAFDKDTAGKKALIRTLEILFQSKLTPKVINWEISLGKDPDEVIAKNPEYWLEAVRNPIDPIEFLYAEFEKKFKHYSFDELKRFLTLITPMYRAIESMMQKEYYVKFLSKASKYTPQNIQNELDGKGNRELVRNKVPQKKINDDKELKKITLNRFDQLFALILQNWDKGQGVLHMIHRESLMEEYLEFYDFLDLCRDEKDLMSLRESLEGSQLELFDKLVLANLNLAPEVTFLSHFLGITKDLSRYYKRAFLKAHTNKDLEEVSRVVSQK